jgi:hypothetical protein
MRSRIVMVVALALALAAVAVSGVRLFTRSSHPPAVKAVLPVSARSYLGVYETGSPPSYQPVSQFAQTVGKTPNLVGYYSGWAEPFPSGYAQMLWRDQAITYVQIDPTLASVSGIASGAYDTYLNTYAESVRNFRHPVVIGFGHEMNGNWYSWGWQHTPPATFVRAWRHIVTLFRTDGAQNVTWLWTVNEDRYNTGPVRQWWPGAQYVTWVGVDGYYVRSSDNFSTVFGRTIRQIRAFTQKPVLLSETAVGPKAGQFGKIINLFDGIRQSKALGLVWFDKTQSDGIWHQNWRLESSTNAAAAFRLGLSSLRLARP